MLTQRLASVESAATYAMRECISAGVGPGLQILWVPWFTCRVAALGQFAAIARNSSCANGAPAYEPGRDGAEVGAVVAAACSSPERRQ